MFWIKLNKRTLFFPPPVCNPKPPPPLTWLHHVRLIQLTENGKSSRVGSETEAWAQVSEHLNTSRSGVCFKKVCLFSPLTTQLWTHLQYFIFEATALFLPFQTLSCVYREESESPLWNKTWTRTGVGCKVACRGSSEDKKAKETWIWHFILIYLCHLLVFAFQWLYFHVNMLLEQ